MATFAGTQRAVYTKDKVKKLRAARKTKKPTTSTIINDTQYQAMLGELKGAGHLTFSQFRKMETDIHRTSPFGLSTKPKVSKTISISYDVLMEDGDKPHLSGYLQSAADVDSKPYRVKGWINEDGTLRLEIVK
jgi:hypothetical protein